MTENKKRPKIDRSEQLPIIPRMRCIDEGVHDFTDPVVIKTKSFLFVMYDSSETTVSICRKCGASSSFGYVNDDD